MDELIALLKNVPEVDLKILGLLRQSQPIPGQFLPRGFSRHTYAEAALEMLHYTRDCADLATRIGKLTPAQIATFPIAEYGL
jgi:hypothetical protein